MAVKVIYIAGQSFSGSTLLCAMLGIHPEVEPVSELAMWTLKAGQTGRRCSCGRTRLECPFWTQVHGTWIGKLEGLSVETYTELQRRIETLRYSWPHLFARLPWPSAGDMELYRRATVALFESVAACGRPIIADSSKKPPRAAALTGAEGLELRVIHLVRDGVSFIEANIRRKKLSPSDRDFLYRVFRLGIEWSAANLAAERALRMNGSRGVQVRYEDLVEDPDAALKMIGAQVELDLACVGEHIRAGRPISWRHMESGSTHRLAGPALLSKDFAARPRFPRRVRLAFYLGGGALSRRYGYL
jgi:hypothetical protein